MTATRPALKLVPERCDRCGRCVGRCKPHAIKLGPGYIYIDSARCDGCLVCADVCDRGAIVRRERASQAPPVARPKIAEQSPGKPRRPRAAPATAVWTSIDALVALLVLLGCLLLVNVALGTQVVRLMPQSGKVFARVAGLAVTYGTVLLVLVGLARRHDIGFAKAFRLRPVFRSLKDVATSSLLVVALLLGTRVIAMGYGVITQLFSWEPSVDWNTDLTTVFGPDFTGFALTVVLVVLVGPFIEELVFRGVVLSALGQLWGIAGSIVISSAIFATYHFSLWMLVPTFVLGLALGWLAEKTEGLWPPIALHVLYNGLTVAIVFWPLSS